MRRYSLIAAFLAVALVALSATWAHAGDGSTQVLTSSNLKNAGCPGLGYSDRFNSSAYNQFNLQIRLYGTNGGLVPTSSSGFDAGTGLVTGLSALSAQRNNYNAGSPENWNYFSAFQLGCGVAGSFINTWTWPQGTITGGGPNVAYEIQFGTPKLIFDANYNELWLQADSVSLPYVSTWGGIGQIVLAAFVQYQSVSGGTQSFQVLAQIYDSRSPYSTTPSAEWDPATNTVFATASDTTNSYLSPGPSGYGYSQMQTGLTTWSNKAFRAQISRSNFVSILRDINAKCLSYRSYANCRESYPIPDAANGSDLNWQRYRLQKVFALHEVFYTGYGNIAMGMNAKGIGAYRYARPGVN